MEITAVSYNPDQEQTDSQTIIEKAKQTEETTRQMTKIVSDNKENAMAISQIVQRFKKQPVWINKRIVQNYFLLYNEKM